MKVVKEFEGGLRVAEGWVKGVCGIEGYWMKNG